MTDRELGRRAFTAGLMAVAGAAALADPARATTRSTAPSFTETTLWDASSGPLANYHVHGLTVLPDDTILAMTEGRHEVCDAGPRDLLLRRSTDRGETWSASQVVVASVDGQSWGNPTPVTDRRTGEVFLFYMLSERLPENTTCSGDSGDLYVVSSTDGGVTWGTPRSLAGLFDGFDYGWALHGPGPGHGIQLDNGRLLLNVAHRRTIVGTTASTRNYGVSTVYSDDHGRTWKAGGAVPVSADYPINEARLLQRSDGSVLVNGRAAAGGNRQRIISISHDRGLTWSPAALDGATGVFNAVDASLVRYTGGPGSRAVDRVLFSRPDAPTRWNMTVSVSYDEAYSLRYSRVINPNRSYYSDLARLSDGTIILLYGCEGDIPSAPLRVKLARFNLEWLTQGRDSLATGPRMLSRTIALTHPSTRRGGTLTLVREPTARTGARAVFTPTSAGDHVEYVFTTAFAGDVLLRYYRPSDGGLVTVTIDGTEPHNATIDTTAETADGYDIVMLETARLRAGRHTVRFTSAGAGRGGGQVISLDSLSVVRAPARADVDEDITIDNGALGFEVVSGSWPAGTGVAGYYGANYQSHPSGDGSATVRWRPALPADATYEVRVSYPAASNRSHHATYTVHHSGGSTAVKLDQTVHGTTETAAVEWASLGTFPFTAGLDGHVELNDTDDGYVIADAMTFTRRT